MRMDEERRANQTITVQIAKRHCLNQTNMHRPPFKASRARSPTKRGEVTNRMTKVTMQPMGSDAQLA